MKIFKWVTVVIAALVTFISCQKQLDFETGGVSVGSLKSAVTGDCLPVTVNGLFKVDSVLNNNSFVDVQVNVSIGGTFDVRSDTVNGYSFSKTGSVGKGLNTIRLYPSGKPLAGGTNVFTIKYGTSVCTFSIIVTGGGTSMAVYTLGGSPGACTGFILAGTYTVGIALTATNTVTVDVNVTAIGTYSISTPTVNGVSFSATGQFLATGPNTVTLTGSGTPTSSVPFTLAVNGSSSNCSFSLVCAAASAYTLGGAGGSCTGYILSGIYAAGIPLTAANTAIIDVNVTVPGGYNISSTTVNGIKFSATGTFTIVGSQTVTLTGTGTPTTAGINLVFPVTGGGTTCSISLGVNPAPVSVYTLDCTGIAVNGNYYVGTALATSNSIVVSVNVTGIGTYTISSLPAVNGISFSKTGIFTSTGVQSVTIPGTGTPTAAGPFNYTLTGGTGSCLVSITAIVGTPGIFTCKIDGVFTSFNEDAHAEITYNLFGTPETFMAVQGRLLPVGTPSDDFHLYISRLPGGTIPAGVYDQNTFVNSLGTYKVGMDYYINSTTTHWTVSDNTPFTPNPPFKITITSITATNCTGTFSGTIKENFGAGTGTKSITEGVFNLPVQ